MCDREGREGVREKEGEEQEVSEREGGEREGRTTVTERRRVE